MPSPGPHEVELKLRLSDESAWRRVRAELADPRAEWQENVFFDRPDRHLTVQKIAVRLRRAESGCRLTVKTDPAPPGQSALTRRVELEVAIQATLFESACRSVLDLSPWISRWRVENRNRGGTNPEIETALDSLARSTSGGLRPMGTFRNERTRGHLTVGDGSELREWEIELDRTLFPGGRTDYELELELPANTSDATAEEVRRVLTRRLSDLNVETGTAPSKLARLIAILDAR